MTSLGRGSTTSETGTTSVSDNSNLESHLLMALMLRRRLVADDAELLRWCLEQQGKGQEGFRERAL
jgi:hypothetical protein